jgi:thioredoxin 1
MSKELVTKLTEGDFKKFVSDRKAKLVIVDFFADWCGPCQMMAPVLEELAVANSTNGVKIGKINVDSAGELANQFQVSSIPCIIFFKNGKEVARIERFAHVEELNLKIEEVL